MNNQLPASQSNVTEIEEILKELPAIIFEITGVDINKRFLDCDDSAA